MNEVIENRHIIKKYDNPYFFYLLSLLIPWYLWFISAYFSHQTSFYSSYDWYEWVTGICIFIGLISPLIITLFFVLPNKDLRKDFFGRFLNFKSIKREYILLAFFLMLFSILVAQAISLFFGYSITQFELRGSFSFTSALFPVWFLLIAAPILEELAWHSYGTDTLVSRFNLFNASMIFSVYWAFWHLPLTFIKGYYHSNLVESGTLYSLNFVISIIPFVIIMNWLYYKTNRNILLPIIFHITAGFFNEIFATHPMSKVIQTGLLLLIAIYLVINDRELFFKRI